jgi:hypothetical protein
MAQIVLSDRDLNNRDRLPMLCMRCGARAVTRVPHEFRFQPWWYRATGVFLDRRTITTWIRRTKVPICDEHRDHWRPRQVVTWIGVGLFLLCFLTAMFGGGLLAMMKGEATGGFPLGGLIMACAIGGGILIILLLKVITFIMEFGEVRITDYNAGYYTFAGVDEDFVDAVMKLRRRGKRRGRAADDDDDDDELDDPPPRKKSSAGVIVAAVLGGAALLLVLVCGGIGFVWYSTYQYAHQMTTQPGGPSSNPGLGPGPTSGDALSRLKDPNLKSREAIEAALDALARETPDPTRKAEVFQTVAPFLKDPRPSAACGLAAKVLGAWAGPDDAPLMAKFVEDRQQEVYLAGLAAAARLRDPLCARAIVARDLNGPATATRGQAVKALESIGRPAEDEVLPAVFHEDQGTRESALALLRGYGTEEIKILQRAIVELQTPNAPKARKKNALDYLAKATPNDSLRTAVARALEPYLTAPAGELSAPAAGVLDQWAGPDLNELLIRSYEQWPIDRDLDQRPSLDYFLKLRDKRVPAAIARRLMSSRQRVRAVAMLTTMSKFAEAEVVPYMNHPDAFGAARGLLKTYGTRDALLIAQCVQDLNLTDPGKCQRALEWLADAKIDEGKQDEVARALNPVLMGATANLADAALKAVEKWGTADNLEPLVKIVADPADMPAERRNKAIALLGRIKDPKAVEALAPLLFAGMHQKQAGNALIALGDIALPKMMDSVAPDKQPDAAARAAAWQVLGFIAPKDRLKDLQAVAAKEKPNSDVAKIAAAALRQIGAR